jgi:SlyX protein
MTATTFDDDRFLELETRVAYQERTIEQLHEVALDLRSELEKLRREFAELQSRIDNDGPAIGPADDRPPHY